MNSFKKIIAVSISFLIFIVAVSVLLIAPYVNSEHNQLFDRYYREELAGTIDTIYLGASQTLRSFNPNLIDEKLGTSSYNLGGSATTWPGREAMLKEEINRNSLKTIYLEITSDALCSSPDGSTEGNLLTIPRLGSLKTRFSYFFHEIPFESYDDYYSLMINKSIWYYFDLFTAKSTKNVVRNSKGFVPYCTNDIRLSYDDALKNHNTSEISLSFDERNLNTVDRIINLCKDKNIEVIILVSPVSDKEIWECYGWDKFYLYLEDLSAKYNCKFYDFNLLKNRYELFSDEKSFFEDVHLSEDGANAFSNSFADIIDDADNGKEMSQFFYKNYEEMKSYSPYNQIIASAK